MSLGLVLVPVLDLDLVLVLVLDLVLGLDLVLNLVLGLSLVPDMVLVHSLELRLTEVAYVPPVHAILTNLTTQQTHRVVYNVHQRRLVTSSRDQHPFSTVFTVRSFKIFIMYICLLIK